MWTFVSFFIHLDQHVTDLVARFGVGTHVVLFFVIFAETGFVVTPFLPGDSLLFTAGAMAGMGALDIWFLLVSCIVAAIIGDATNYWIGQRLGLRLFEKMHGTLVKRDHLEQAQAFYARHGKKAIVLARFLPIVRTFAPFVAGMAKMDYRTFAVYNVSGAVAWVGFFTLIGYFFGNSSFVQEHFSLFIFAIIGVSVLMALVEYVKNKR